MRFLLKSIAALIGVLAVAVAAWVVFAKTSVTVSVFNDSKRPIAWVKVLDEQDVYNFDGIAIGESRVLEFSAHGETTYSLVIGFEDGSELRGEALYAEAGYVFSATVSESSVSNRFERMSYL